MDIINAEFSDGKVIVSKKWPGRQEVSLFSNKRFTVIMCINMNDHFVCR